jgi:hypothetical protein
VERGFFGPSPTPIGDAYWIFLLWGLKKRQLMYDEPINKNSRILSTPCRALDAAQP